jgi:hypothetical protein
VSVAGDVELQRAYDAERERDTSNQVIDPKRPDKKPGGRVVTK